MRLGVYGGSFDPVHFGHLVLAECCRESARLDVVWLIPTAQQPHKSTRLLTPVRQRLEMLELAVAGNPDLEVSSIEADRGGVSYTVETLSQIHEAHPDAELFFLMGADALRDLPAWREPARICELATPLVVGRPGVSIADLSFLEPVLDRARLEQVRRHHVEMPQIEISSSDLRDRVRGGQSIRYRTPRAVEEYIAFHGLYRDH